MLAHPFQYELSSSFLALHMKNIAHYIALSFQSGRSLRLVEGDLRTYVPQMVELKRDLCTKCANCYWQMILNLLGTSENTIVMQGTALHSPQEILDDVETPAVVGVFKGCQSRLYAVFGEYEIGAHHALANEDFFHKVSPGNPLIVADTFCQGLSLFSMARRTKKNKKYVKRAKQIRAQIKTWVKKGNPNVQHYEALMEAEYAALTGKSSLAELQYQSAVTIAARGGFVHDAAMASERYADFKLRDQSDKQDATYHLNEAIRFYTIWGATRKVEMLQENYRDLLK